jgi:hypothetical protein
MTEYCGEEETQRRIEICKQCDSFIVEETGTRCAECAGGCSISLLVSHTDQVCPKGNW